MRFSKIFAATVIAAASSASFAGNIISVAALPSSPVAAITTLGVRSAQEYIVTTDDPANTFASFCLDQYASYFGNSLPNPDPFTIGAFTPTQAAELSKLFTGAGWQSWDPVAEAARADVQKQALGLAVWDIMTDGTFDFAGGSMQILNDGYGGAAVSFANAAYAAGNVNRAGDLIMLDLTDPKLQNMVVMVPEPSTYAMLLAGLAGVGFVARRRQNRG